MVIFLLLCGALCYQTHGYSIPYGLPYPPSYYKGSQTYEPSQRETDDQGTHAHDTSQTDIGQSTHTYDTSQLKTDNQSYHTYQTSQTKNGNQDSHTNDSNEPEMTNQHTHPDETNRPDRLPIRHILGYSWQTQWQQKYGSETPRNSNHDSGHFPEESDDYSSDESGDESEGPTIYDETSYDTEPASFSGKTGYDRKLASSPEVIRDTKPAVLSSKVNDDTKPSFGNITDDTTPEKSFEIISDMKQSDPLSTNITNDTLVWFPEEIRNSPKPASFLKDISDDTTPIPSPEAIKHDITDDTEPEKSSESISDIKKSGPLTSNITNDTLVWFPGEIRNNPKSASFLKDISDDTTPITSPETIKHDITDETKPEKSSESINDIKKSGPLSSNITKDTLASFPEEIRNSTNTSAPVSSFKDISDDTIPILSPETIKHDTTLGSSSGVSDDTKPVLFSANIVNETKLISPPEAINDDQTPSGITSNDRILAPPKVIIDEPASFLGKIDDTKLVLSPSKNSQDINTLLSPEGTTADISPSPFAEDIRNDTQPDLSLGGITDDSDDKNPGPSLEVIRNYTKTIPSSEEISGDAEPAPFTNKISGVTKPSSDHEAINDDTKPAPSPKAISDTSERNDSNLSTPKPPRTYHLIPLSPQPPKKNKTEYYRRTTTRRHGNHGIRSRPVRKFGLLFAPSLQWHVGVYSKSFTPYMQVCGGSLVKADVVLSAAHCFWGDEAGALRPGLFAVAAGKLLRPWETEGEIYAQHSDIEDVKIPPRFRGSKTSFQDDIAVVLLTRALEYAPGVKPVCISFDQGLEREHLTSGNLGTIAGWGLTEPNGSPSQRLNYLKLPYVDIEDCLRTADDSFMKYITSDKICAGDQKTGSALCRGDSGGGLVYYSSTIPYLHGIASTAPKDDNLCNAYAVASFTHVLAHRRFLIEHVPDIAEGCEQLYVNKTGSAQVNWPQVTPTIKPEIARVTLNNPKPIQEEDRIFTNLALESEVNTGQQITTLTNQIFETGVSNAGQQISNVTESQNASGTTDRRPAFAVLETTDQVNRTNLTFGTDVSNTEQKSLTSQITSGELTIKPEIASETLDNPTPVQEEDRIFTNLALESGVNTGQQITTLTNQIFETGVSNAGQQISNVTESQNASGTTDRRPDFAVLETTDQVNRTNLTLGNDVSNTEQISLTSQITTGELTIKPEIASETLDNPTPVQEEDRIFTNLALESGVLNNGQQITTLTNLAFQTGVSNDGLQISNVTESQNASGTTDRRPELAVLETTDPVNETNLTLGTDVSNTEQRLTTQNTSGQLTDRTPTEERSELKKEEEGVAKVGEFETHEGKDKKECEKWEKEVVMNVGSGERALARVPIDGAGTLVCNCYCNK